MVSTAAPDARQSPAALPGRRRFAALDSWRGLAAIMVVLFHAQIVSHVHAFGLVRAGEAFVDLFFVLSGFVIAHAYRDRLGAAGDLRRFFIARLGRIYPLHLFMLVLFLAFEIGKSFTPGLVNAADPAFSGTNDPLSLASNLLLLQAFWPGDTLSWNTPSWSISAEFLAYILFAVAMTLGRRRIAWWLAGAAVAACLGLVSLSANGMMSAQGGGFMRAIYGFAVGALVYRIWFWHGKAAVDQAVEISRVQWTGFEIVTAAGAVAFAWQSHGTPASYALPLVFALLVAVFAQEQGMLSTLLRTWPLLTLGTLSYSIYMVHMFVLLRATNLARLADRLFETGWIRHVGKTARYGEGIDVGNMWAGDIVVLGIVAATLAASFFTYRYVERPGQRLAVTISDRRWRRRTALPAVATVTGR